MCGPCTRDNVECRWDIGPKRHFPPDTAGKKAGTKRMKRRHSDASAGISENRTNGRDAIGSGVNWLKLVDTEGSVRHYGPMSTFAHLPENSPNSVLSNTSCSPENLSTLPWICQNGQMNAYQMSTSVSGARPSSLMYGHLPTNVNLTWEEHEELLNLFEAFFGSFCMVVDISLFREDLTRTHGQHTTNYFSPLLHNAILGLAVHFSNKVHSPSDAAFSAKAASYILQECEKPMMSTIKGLVILGSLQTLLSREDLSSLYLSMALSLAKSFGLHIDCAQLVQSGQMSADQAKMRRDQFWSLYALEKLWCIALGRTSTFLDYNVPTYTVDPIIDEKPWLEPHRFQLDRPQSHMTSASKASSTFYWFCKLLMVASDINSNLCSLKVDKRPIGGTQVQSLRHRLKVWKDQLPPEMQLNIEDERCPPPMLMIMHMYFWLLVILLNQPQAHGRLARKSGDADAIAASEQAASEALELLLTYPHAPPAHIAYAAASVMLMSSVTLATPTARKEAMLQKFDQCVELLTKMQHVWAAQTAGILNKLKDEWIPSSAPTTRSSSAKLAVTEPNRIHAPDADTVQIDMEDIFSSETLHSFNPSEGQASTLFRPDISDAIETSASLQSGQTELPSAALVGSLWPMFHSSGVPYMSFPDGTEDYWSQWMSLFPETGDVTSCEFIPRD
uniref:Xylanolytic transcriptional activator regulatory domain-containing protein n=1 Tax=Kwoniella pini CBS 10737 TaxID=1296096 RepID=A0A1B9HWZ5_9TREE|nr:uncharacterized protein I206_06702 [Kwoniella pini CBS 10737]OCF47795.1 hypothetical protein I206_06702 [Kwoniella pini CBS 10737]